ncbi:putative pentatricopeptide repeat domain containing protein [Lyophyllum shimeji]|uniref:Pentatricopeptide repeat domain containing protein n=1 Tax=Lyophyllum shimeji TaxID=47721 RepID=A0A9P3PIV6_LYOSH|nr:putative pentatricopeptide repeat domain containing protein [Lyophyllum shimeji]
MAVMNSRHAAVLDGKVARVNVDVRELGELESSLVSYIRRVSPREILEKTFRVFLLPLTVDAERAYVSSASAAVTRRRSTSPVEIPQGFGTSAWTSTWLSMLRRVGLVHRQQLDHFGVLSASSKLSLLSQAFPALHPPRWMGSTAAAPRPALRHSRNTQTSRAVALPTLIRTPAQTNLPPEVIALIEEVVSRPTDEPRVLMKIRACPDLLEHLTNAENVRKLAEKLALTHHPLRSLHLLSVAHAVGCRLKHNAYECVSFRLAGKRHWNGVLLAASLAKQHLGQMSSRLLNWRARALVEVEDYTGLQGIIAEFKENNLSPTRRTFHLLLSGHIRDCNLSLAKQCLAIMTEAGCPPDASTHALVATHYRRLGLDSNVESRSLEALRDVRDTTATAVVNSLIQLRLDAHDLSGALQLLKLFKPADVDVIIATMAVKEGVNTTTPDLSSFHTLHLNLLPNAATFSIFINYHASKSNLSGALRIFRSMLSAGINPTSGSVASLLHVFFATQQGDLAVQMVAQICNTKGVKPSMFKRLLSSQATDDLPWIPAGVEPTVQVFNALLKGVLHTRGLSSTRSVLRIMHASNVRPTAATLEILLAHLSKVERAHPSVLLRLLRQLSSPDIRPTLRHMHIILSCVLRHEKYLLYGRGWNTIAAKYSTRRTEPEHHYPEHRISSEADLFDPTAGIALPRALSLRRLACPSVESLSSRSILSDTAMISLRIRRDAAVKSDIDAAKDLFHTLLSRGMHPNEYHFSGLMEGLARSGDVEGALDVMRAANRAGVKPNVVMFTILIVGHARQGNPGKAMQVFRDMVSSGVTPDVPSIDAVASAFFAVGAYDMAKKVLRSLWPYIEPFPDELRNARLKTLAVAFRSLHDENRNGVKPPSKEERLALRLELNKLRAIWQRGSRKDVRTPGASH